MIPSDAVNTGWNAENQTYRDDRYVRCWNCGYIAHLDRDGREPVGSWTGDGYTRNQTQLNGAVSVNASTITVDSTTGFTTPSSGSITALANPNLTQANFTRVTSTSHGLSDETLIDISGTTSYNGTWKITNKTANTFDIPIKYVANDATGTWKTIEYIYIYDAGTYATSEDADSAYTKATGAPRVNKVSYTGKTSTTFTGCSGVTAHDDNMFVRDGQEVERGCPFCGVLHFDSRL